MNINDLKIIDTHHHLWDPTTKKYDWLTASGHEVFNHVYRKENFINDFQGLNVIKSVHVQAEINLADTVYETEWMQQISEAENDSNDNKLPNAIIGFADFLDSYVEKTLEMHLQYPNFRGIRHILNYDKNNKEISHAKFDYLKEDLWLNNFSLLEKYNLSFDLSILFNQTEDAVKLVNKYSNTLFIINHTLSPINIDEKNINVWLDKIKLLSSFDNVAIKLSGFGEFNSSWTQESIRPLILESVKNFGVERCMFGSNFPVDKYLSSSRYADYWMAYFNTVSDFSESEIDKLFYKNAEKFYRI